MSNRINNSFIPKRGPAKARTTSARPVFVFTLISYVIFFTTLLASGTVYLFKTNLENKLATEASGLVSDMNTFSATDLQRVLEFDQRLKQATGRVEKSISLAPVFEMLESMTINTVMIKSLEIERIDDIKLSLVAEISTDSLDSTAFQRNIYELNRASKSFESIQITDLKAESFFQLEGEDVPESVFSNVQPELSISFNAEIDILLSSIPYRKYPLIDKTQVFRSVTDDVVNNFENI